jgi:hypothetical protein
VYDYRDILSGGCLFVIGGFVTVYAGWFLPLGTLSSMGPGMFPAALGIILMAFGVALFVPALFRQGSHLATRFWAPLYISIAIALFTLTLPRLGLIPAVLTLTIVSSFAELEIRLVRLAVLSFSLCVLAYLLFRVGLGMSLPMFQWRI